MSISLCFACSSLMSRWVGAARRAPKPLLGEQPGQNEPKKVSKFHHLLPKHPFLSARACKEIDVAAFPSIAAVKIQQMPLLSH